MTEINKYHTSKIYKITSPHCNKFYIGSTTMTLKRRLSNHKAKYNIYIKKGIGSCMASFEIVKFDDCIIELIKDVKCENRQELLRIEGEYIKEYHDKILNKNVAGRTIKEYYKEYRETNKDIFKEYYKEYRETNKDIIKEHREANNEKIICLCGGKYVLYNKSAHNKTKKHQLFISTN